MWDFPGNADIQRVTREIYEAGGVVGAVCHGPAALVNITLSNGAQLVAGKNVSAFTDSEERAVQLDGVVPFLLASKLEQHGAHHHSAPDWTAKVVVDGRLITGQNPQSASGVGAAMRDALLAAELQRTSSLWESRHESDAVVDRELITGRNPGFGVAVGQELLKRLKWRGAWQRSATMHSRVRPWLILTQRHRRL